MNNFTTIRGVSPFDLVLALGYAGLASMESLNFLGQRTLTDVLLYLAVILIVLGTFFRRLGDAIVSGAIMLCAGSVVGIVAAGLVLSHAGVVGVSSQVPWSALTANLAIILLAFMTFGAISTRADVAQATNRAN